MPDIEKKNRPRIEAFEDARSKREGQPYFVNLNTLESLALQNIPNELGIDPNSNWATIDMPGRNVPKYHFTGSEDVLKFTISWYSDHNSRKDVLLKCKWLESLSKNDGYNKKAPEVLFIFGELFKNTKWIMASAPYKIGLFDREFGMLPRVATQEITLKRISNTNPSTEDILSLNF